MDQTVGPHHPEVLAEEIGVEVILLDPRNGKYYSLNQTASDVWRLCDGNSSLEDLVGLLAKAYQREPSDIRPDVVEAVDGFRAAGLLSE
jgi:hypothetical protein